MDLSAYGAVLEAHSLRRAGAAQVAPVTVHPPLPTSGIHRLPHPVDGAHVAMAILSDSAASSAAAALSSSFTPSPAPKLLNFERFAEMQPVALFWADAASCEIRWTNAKFRQATGCDCNLELDANVHSSDRIKVRKWRERLVLHQQDDDLEFRWQDSDEAGELWCYISVAVDRDLAGVCIGFVGILSK